MGVYVNPLDETKEVWLRREGKLAHGVDLESLFDANGKPIGNDRIVCLVNNGPFTAAAVAYNKREYLEFTRSNDHRPKTWFIVDKDKLESVTTDLALYENL